ncbi:uncharacterized protein COLE_05670 [Cutaneotrichosporon oleaginosum]|uniref:uncharacterized protein n=1 Tax=Cutaneotrichosporon oleaginosum TaxID=879819 RepID=UPI001323F88B|nr:hypothetical protein COLE_05670 [Cutaneotrichosporon oleaginosum]
MNHSRTVSAPPQTCRRSKRNGMLFTRPFSLSDYESTQVSTLSDSSHGDYSRQESRWRAARASAPSSSSISPSAASPSAISPCAPSPSATSDIDMEEIWTAQTSHRATQAHPTCPAQSYLSRTTPSRTSSSSAYSSPRSSSRASTLSLSPSLSAPSGTPARAPSPPLPTLPPPSLTSLALVSRTPLLELAMNPALVIRPVVPCERCALYAHECMYDPDVLVAVWDGEGDLPLPKCAACPDDEGCWHVLGGRMIRPRARVFEHPTEMGINDAWTRAHAVRYGIQLALGYALRLLPEVGRTLPVPLRLALSLARMAVRQAVGQAVRVAVGLAMRQVVPARRGGGRAERVIGGKVS